MKLLREPFLFSLLAMRKIPPELPISSALQQLLLLLFVHRSKHSVRKLVRIPYGATDESSAKEEKRRELLLYQSTGRQSSSADEALHHSSTSDCFFMLDHEWPTLPTSNSVDARSCSAHQRPAGGQKKRKRNTKDS